MVDNLKAPDILRIYDAGIKAFLTNSIKIADKEVPNVIASPEKVFAEMTRIQNSQDKTLRPMLPFISITRIAQIHRPEFYNRIEIGAIKYTDEEEKMDAISTRYPAPITVSYQFDLWCKFKDHQNQYIQAFHLLYNHPTYVKFKIDNIMNDKICYFTLESLTDNSDLEPSADKNITYRTSVVGTLHAWFFYDYYLQKTVGEYSIEIYSANKNLTVPISSPESNPVEFANDEYELEKILTGGV